MRGLNNSPKHYFCKQSDKLRTIIALKAPFFSTSLVRAKKHKFSLTLCPARTFLRYGNDLFFSVEYCMIALLL